jgi:N6-L-threonylcarbamoyladenine synthase
MGYPGGPLIDALSTEGDPRAIKFPAGHLEKDSLNFSFSGLKTAVLYYVNGKKGRERDASWMSRQQKADVAASFQRTAADMLVEKLRRAAGRYETRSIIVGGGVSANRGIRAAVAELGRELGVTVHVPAMKYTTDNGAMVAGMGTEMLRKGRVAGMGLETVATV